MNVLLSEAQVEYGGLVTDVDDVDTLITRADLAQRCIVMKRSMGAGFAGVERCLFRCVDPVVTLHQPISCSARLLHLAFPVVSGVPEGGRGPRRRRWTPRRMAPAPDFPVNPVLLQIAALVVFAAWIPVSALSAQSDRGAEPPVAPLVDGGQPISVGLVNQAPAVFDGSALSAEGTVVRTSRRSLDGVERLTFLLRDSAGDTISVRDAEALPVVGARVQVTGVVAARADGVVELAGGAGGLLLTVLESPAGEADGVSGDALASTADPCLASPGVFRSIACSMAERSLAVPVGAGVLLVIGVATLLLMRRQPAEDDSPIPLIVDLNRGRMEGGQNGGEPAPPPIEPSAPASRPTPATNGRAPTPEAPPASPAVSPVHALVETGRLAVPGLVGDPSPPRHDPPVADPGDGMLQMLPGRLEVLEGGAIGPEIRFFRVSSLDVPEITFGRFEGPAYRHVQLDAPTVSRLHARIRFADRRWRLTNLSEMNPVVVNEQQLGGEDYELVLADGDRVVIGSFVFRFRDPRS